MTGRASRSWMLAAVISHVHRSAASGSRSRGRVQPKVCLNSLNVCSRSNEAAVTTVTDTTNYGKAEAQA